MKYIFDQVLQYRGIVNTLINLSIYGIIKVGLYFYFCHYKVFIFAFLPPAEMTCWNSNNGNVS